MTSPTIIFSKTEVSIRLADYQGDHSSLMPEVNRNTLSDKWGLWAHDDGQPLKSPIFTPRVLQTYEAIIVS